jgi:peroxiredoxin
MIEGRTLPRITVQAANRSDTTSLLDFAAAPATLVLAFNSECQFCELNVASWRSLIDQAASYPGLRILAVADEPLPSAAGWVVRSELQVQFAAVPSTPGALRSQWHLAAVPATYLVDSTGRVARAMFGVLTKSEVAAVLRHVRMTLGPTQ